MGPNKLECLSLASLSRLVQRLRVRPKPTRWERGEGQASQKHLTRLEWPARDKHSSLLGSNISYEEKKGLIIFALVIISSFSLFLSVPVSLPEVKPFDEHFN